MTAPKAHFSNVTSIVAFALIVSILGLLSGNAQSPPTRRALLVGVEYADSDKPEAADTRRYDVDRFKALLKGSFNFKEGDIHTLLNKEATSAQIVREFRNHLIDKSEPGDVAVFLFTGHGMQVPDFDGDEKDNVDEALCTYDIDPRNPKTWFTDDVLGHLISQIKTDRVLMINTACHSGTSTRGTVTPDDMIVESMNSGFSRRGEADGFNPIRENGDASHVLLSGCQAAQSQLPDGYRETQREHFPYFSDPRIQISRSGEQLPKGY